VDVNVHPAKVEVRFRESSEIYAVLQKAVRGALDAGAERNLESPGGAAVPVSPGMSPRPAGGAGAPPDALAAIREAALEFLRSPERAPVARPRANGGIARPQASPSGPMFAESPPDPGFPAAAAAPPPRTLPAFQVLDSYIVLESPEGLVLIDQHAFHEKIIFEEVVRRMREGTVESQRLLLPEVVDVPPAWMPVTGDVARALAPFGFEIEPFGDTAVAIHAFPGILDRETGGTDLGAIVRAAFESALEHGGKPLEEPGGEAPGALGAAVRRLAATIACKRAVKAGQRLRDDEIQSLIARGELAEDPRHCPHGRPAAVFLTRRDLERQFDRR
jgi:DNA mismatch repair protein MutL